MAHNPHAPQGPQDPDPAGSTQMFRAFVDEEVPEQRRRSASAGPRLGVILGIALGITALAAVAWLAFS
ncbi:hypothetical protein PJ985_00945 [Streptomyces sp. ACA25]|uniref:hypothetical protein n=1 Tax=Streptomyces sp. ACA25 TaxID=3022596 RepID=UPI0023076ADF|nr:hypothetical protein [Streptomyces sp. ACA25]MDB1086146.1 hypothetical protein [Streptomyces sp. ACA25]